MKLPMVKDEIEAHRADVRIGEPDADPGSWGAALSCRSQLALIDTALAAHDAAERERRVIRFCREKCEAANLLYEEGLGSHASDMSKRFALDVLAMLGVDTEGL